jgi:ATP synthase protein I
MTNDPERDKLDALAARIRQAGEKAGIRPPETAKTNRNTASVTRIGSDFVVTVLVCTGLGWLADREMGTTPWGIVAMLFIGFAAGVMNVWRALEGQRKQEEDERPEEDKREEDKRTD